MPGTHPITNLQTTSTFGILRNHCVTNESHRGLDCGLLVPKGKLSCKTQEMVSDVPELLYVGGPKLLVPQS